VSLLKSPMKKDFEQLQEGLLLLVALSSAICAWILAAKKDGKEALEKGEVSMNVRNGYYNRTLYDAHLR